MSQKEYKFNLACNNINQPINGLEDIRVKIFKYFIPHIVTGGDLRYLSQIQPGIFITGGTARATALKEVCNVSEWEVIPPTDVDWITLSDRKIHVKKSILIDERKKIPVSQNTPKLLHDHFEQTDFGVDALFVGRFSENDEPTLYLSSSAEKAYNTKTIDFAPRYWGIDKNMWGYVTNISNRKVGLRSLLFEMRLGKHGFRSKINKELVRKALERDWGRLLNDYSILDYVSRAKHDGNMYEYIELLREYGFTVPKNIIQCIESYPRDKIVEMIINTRS